MAAPANSVPQDFAGKTIIVTGAGSGVGRAVAPQQVAARGAHAGAADTDVNGAIIPVDGGWTAG